MPAEPTLKYTTNYILYHATPAIKFKHHFLPMFYPSQIAIAAGPVDLA